MFVLGYRILLFWGLFSASTCIAGADLSKISWMSEQYAPYNWRVDDGTPAKGIFIDLLHEIVGQKLDFDAITFYPWARSYHRLQKQPNTALFTMTKTAERDQLFTLSRPVMPSIVGIICRKSVIEKLLKEGKLDQSYQIGKSLENGSPLPYLSVGVVREDIGDQLLQKAPAKPKKVSRANSFTMLARKLYHGRLDAIAYNTHVIRWHFKQMEKTYKTFNPDDFVMIYVLGRKPMAFAFHKQTDPAVVDLFNKGLIRLQKAGRIEAILKKYLD